MPITLTGVNDLTVTQALQISELKIISGATFNPNGNSNVAIIGQDLATKNNLKVGSQLPSW